MRQKAVDESAARLCRPALRLSRPAAPLCRRGRGQDLGPYGFEVGGERAVARRAVDHGLQRSQLRRLDAEALQPGKIGLERRAAVELVAHRLGEDGDRGGIVAGGGVLDRDAGFVLCRRELRLDLVEPGRGGGEVGGDRLRRAGFQFRHPRLEAGNLALRGVDV